MAEREKKGLETRQPKEASSGLDDTFCVTAVFVEFPAGQPLTHPCLYLLNSVRVYSFPIGSQHLLLILVAMNYSQLY